MGARFDEFERRFFRVVGIFSTIVISGAIVVSVAIFIYVHYVDPASRYKIPFRGFILGVIFLGVLLQYAVSLIGSSRKSD